MNADQPDQDEVERVAREVFAAICPGSEYTGEAQASYEEVVRQTLERSTGAALTKPAALPKESGQ